MDFEFKEKYNIDDFIQLITLLRAPNGCPWDREQTHASIKKNFIEETYEVIEAINKEDSSLLREELGDVLLQIGLHTEIERELGSFDFDDVVNDICQKLVIRHPHVFGSVTAKDTDEALSNWDEVKAKTKGRKTRSESMLTVPLELPSLMRSQKVQKYASKAGFDWENSNGAFDKLSEEINELKKAISTGKKNEIEEEFGDLLFSAVNIARFIKVDSEEALTLSCNKFINRFQVVEKLATERGINLEESSAEILDSLWEEAKKILSN